MSKFESVLKKIEEALPQMPATKPIVPNTSGQQPNQQQNNPELIKQLVAAKTEQEVELILQKMQGVEQAQQKPTTPGQTQQPAV